jgi:hypothetical protein
MSNGCCCQQAHHTVTKRSAGKPEVEATCGLTSRLLDHGAAQWSRLSEQLVHAAAIQALNKPAFAAGS